jgi:opacity protein-like surface antigen
MKSICLLALLAATSALAAPPATEVVGSQKHTATPAADAADWKGPDERAELHFGGLAGMGTVDSQAGFVVLGTISKKIIHHGFVPDIANSVSVEIQAGPLFVYSTAIFAYSAHLRWDFQKDERWTIYAIGGLAGDVTGPGLGSRFILLPRFGVGSFLKLNEMVYLRGELSREVIGLGVAIPL